MSEVLADAVVEIRGDFSGLLRDFNSARGMANTFTSTFRNVGARLGTNMLAGFHGKVGGGVMGNTLISSLGTVAASGAALTAGTVLGAAIAGAIGVAIVGKVGGVLYDLVKESIDLAASMQATEVAFGIFLGDAKQAKALMKDIWQFAAKTPFEMPELTDAAKSLLAYGESGKSVMETLRKIGDVSSGLSVPIQEMAQVYGRARVQGRAYARDLHELTNRGVPIIQELAKQFGVADDAVMKLAENGDVQFKNIEQAFTSLSAKGGKFADMMSKQSQITQGLASTLRDNIGKIERDFGEVLLPAVEATYRALIRLTQINFGPLMLRVQAFAMIWEYHLLPAIEDSVYQMRLFSATTQLAFAQMILSAQNAKEAVIALTKSMAGVPTIPNVQASTKEIDQLRKDIIDITAELVAAKSGRGSESEAEDFTGDKFSPSGKAPKAAKEKATHEQSGMQALGEQFRKMQELHNDPKLKVAEKQLAEAQETNRLLAAGAAGAGKGKEAEKPEAVAAKTKKQLREERAAQQEQQKAKDREWHEFLKKSKGKGIPSYFSPESKRRREAAAEARKKREEEKANSPLMKKRAELRAAEEARKADYKAERDKRDAARKKRNEDEALARFKKERDLNETKQKRIKEMRAKGMYVPPDKPKRKGNADYEDFLKRRREAFFNAPGRPNISPADLGRRNRRAAGYKGDIDAAWAERAPLTGVARLMQGPGFAPRVPERSRFQQLHGRGTAFDRFKLAQERQHQAFLKDQREKAAKQRAGAPADRTAQQQLKEAETTNDTLLKLLEEVEKNHGGGGLR